MVCDYQVIFELFNCNFELILDLEDFQETHSPTTGTVNLKVNGHFEHCKKIFTSFFTDSSKFWSWKKLKVLVHAGSVVGDEVTAVCKDGCT